MPWWKDLWKSKSYEGLEDIYAVYNITIYIFLAGSYPDISTAAAEIQMDMAVDFKLYLLLLFRYKAFDIHNCHKLLHISGKYNARQNTEGTGKLS